MQYGKMGDPYQGGGPWVRRMSGKHLVGWKRFLVFFSSCQRYDINIPFSFFTVAILYPSHKMNNKQSLVSVCVFACDVWQIWPDSRAGQQKTEKFCICSAELFDDDDDDDGDRSTSQKGFPVVGNIINIFPWLRGDRFHHPPSPRPRRQHRRHSFH